MNNENEYLQGLNDSRSMVYKEIPIKVKSVDKKKHTIKIYTSLAVKDRAGDYIDPAEFDFTNYDKHRIFLADHNYSIYYIIGKEIDRGIDENGLWQELEYFIDFDGERGDLAKWAWYLVNHGVGAFSIGFDPQLVEFDDENDRTNLKKIEFYEVSQIAIPMNPDASQGSEYNIALKAFLLENKVTDKFLNMVKSEDIYTDIKKRLTILEELSLEIKAEIIKLSVNKEESTTSVLADEDLEFISADEETEKLDFIDKSDENETIKEDNEILDFISED